MPTVTAQNLIEVRNKFSDEVIGQVPKSNEQDVKDAVSRAQEVFKTYSNLPAHARAKILETTSGLLAKNREEIASLICKEAGKAWKYSLAEVDRSTETFKFAAEEAKRIHGETVPLDASTSGEGRFGFYIRTPIGVIAAISPFNFPLNLVAHKVAPALAAGNTVVLKPASATALTAVYLAKLLQEAGLPDGALNLVYGGGTTVGTWLITDPRPAMITFTGSPSVGEQITKQAGLKKLIMELGNNGGVIIEPDANLEEAAPRCAMSAFANSGQVCLSLQRIYVHESIAEKFTQKLVEATSSLKVGNPTDRDCDVGPMISEEEAVRAVSWIKEAVTQGAKVLIGGERKGSTVMPTVLSNVKANMRVMCQEIFAPVVSVVSYANFEDALRQLGDSEYGLQSGIYTNDIRKILKAIKEVNVGGLMINDTPIFRVDHMPYGGNKLSGLGREGVRYAVEEMTNIRMVVIKA